jgi:hypothetical protein
MAKIHPLSPPPESSGLRAKDLKNLPCLVLPGEQLQEEKSAKDDKPWEFVECEVIVLDRSGIVQRADGVRISWARAVPQLLDAKGQWLAVRPVEDGNAVVLEELTGADLEVAKRVLDELDENG